ncbi:solute carrier family 2, facilitated glucose transporter member 10 isoform X2 [Amia ocellicauda]|uniref:solute carrier family 2, facilitated glucose transporter member 10 isoform X2 n=1 Tax=Amia ocellicauda TaxID=2972642 RepID=UPI003464342F
MGCSILFLSSAVSTLGGLVFGYELGIISGVLLQLQTEFHLSCLQQEVVVSALLLGALSASLIGGVLIDCQGRRNSILLSTLLILGGSLILTLSGSVFFLVAGRIVVGFAMSISSMSCCIFISEMVSPQRRGLLVTLYEAGITIGILTAYAMNYVLSDFKGGWRYMFGLVTVPSLVQFGAICFLPSHSGSQVKVTQEAPNQIQLTSAGETEDGPTLKVAGQCYTILNLFQAKDNMRSRTLIGLGLVLFQQFTGQPNVLFYASTIFHSVGFQSDASAVLASVGLGAVKVIATLISMSCADRVGRRALLIGGCVVMSASVTAIGLLSQHNFLHPRHTCSADNHLQSSLSSTAKPTLILDPHTLPTTYHSFERTKASAKDIAVLGASGVSQSYSVPQLSSMENSPNSTQGTEIYSKLVKHRIVNWITLLSMMAFVSAYSVGFGPMTWLVLSEIFPAAVRGRAFAFTNCFNWAAHLIVTFTFLNVIDTLGLSWTFLLYGMTGVLAVVFIYLLLPETKGKSLEEIDKELSGKRSYHRGNCCHVCCRKRISSAGYQRVELMKSGE